MKAFIKDIDEESGYRLITAHIVVTLPFINCFAAKPYKNGWHVYELTTGLRVTNSDSKTKEAARLDAIRILEEKDPENVKGIINNLEKSPKI